MHKYNGRPFREEKKYKIINITTAESTENAYMLQGTTYISLIFCSRSLQSKQKLKMAVLNLEEITCSGQNILVKRVIVYAK